MSIPRAELIFVRAVTALLWFCLLPFAPFWLYIAGWVPLTANRIALIVGCSLLMVVPVAAPQALDAYERVKAEIRREVEAKIEAERRLRDEQHANLAREIQQQGDTVSKISARVEPIPVLSATVERMNRTLSWVAVSVVTWVVSAFLGLLGWSFRHFVLRRGNGRPA